jgi:hypothetical protein
MLLQKEGLVKQLGLDGERVEVRRAGIREEVGKEAVHFGV